MLESQQQAILSAGSEFGNLSSKGFRLSYEKCWGASGRSGIAEIKFKVVAYRACKHLEPRSQRT